MTRLFAFGVSPQLVAIGCIPTCRLLSAFVILKNRCSVFMFSICEVRTGLTDCDIRCFIGESLHQHRLDVTWPCSIADGFRLIAALSQSLRTKVTLMQPFWSQWDRRFFAHGCNNIGHPRSPPTVFSSATVLQWLNWSINGIHLFNGAVEHFFTQTCYFLRCWWESL